MDPAVITVGSIHGGQGNSIPGEVQRRLAVRSYRPEVRKHLLDAIERVAKGEALAAGAKREPRFRIADDPAYPVYNDPALTARIAAAQRKALGPRVWKTSRGAPQATTFPRTDAPACPP